MRFLLLLPLVVVSGFLYAEDAPEVPQVDEPPAEVVMPDTVWDGEAMERVTVDEWRSRMASRGRRGVVVEQVPFVRPMVVDGAAVLARRIDADQRYWAHVIHAQDLLATPLRFK